MQLLLQKQISKNMGQFSKTVFYFKIFNFFLLWSGGKIYFRA
jgi:hypothetical protein